MAVDVDAGIVEVDADIVEVEAGIVEVGLSVAIDVDTPIVEVEVEVDVSLLQATRDQKKPNFSSLGMESGHTSSGISIFGLM